MLANIRFAEYPRDKLAAKVLIHIISKVIIGKILIKLYIEFCAIPKVNIVNIVGINKAQLVSNQ